MGFKDSRRELFLPVYSFESQPQFFLSALISAERIWIKL